MSLKEEILSYAFTTFNTTADYLFEKFPEYAVLRHKRNNKWYGLVMSVNYNQLGLKGTGKVDILVAKAPPELVAMLKHLDGYLPAYHMNKEHWVTIKLDGTVEKNKILQLLHDSFLMTR
ncbi:MmcQ/YjbR family DNA-binding protein [Enterococcus sp. AZ109]|uniref:MmcQ/YjbR family DNA-binding protein n=1 Tax=Enterococcus sp. AZ109 TaxID=2774634 RepID=UPI003F223316